MPTTFSWPVNRSGLPALPEEGDPPSAEYIKAATERNAAESIAVAIMHWLSGRQFGLQTVIARPCPGRRPSTLWWGFRSMVSYEAGRWDTGVCGCVGSCTLSGPNAAHLPGPVHAVDSVALAGVTLAPNVWVIEGNVLYRRDAPWPSQDLGKPLGQQGTWSVTYQRGIPVPAGVAELTGLLAKEILEAINNEGRCRLPRTVTTASRQGVTYRAYDPAVIYKNGKTGLPEVDLWLSGVNPSALRNAPSVL